MNSHNTDGHSETQGVLTKCVFLLCDFWKETAYIWLLFSVKQTFIWKRYKMHNFFWGGGGRELEGAGEETSQEKHGTEWGICEWASGVTHHVSPWEEWSWVRQEQEEGPNMSLLLIASRLKLHPVTQPPWWEAISKGIHLDQQHSFVS